MIESLVTLLIFCIVGGLIYYLVTLLPLPEPFKTAAIVIVIVIFIIILLSMLLGAGPIHLNWRN